MRRWRLPRLVVFWVAGQRPVAGRWEGQAVETAAAAAAAAFFWRPLCFDFAV